MSLRWKLDDKTTGLAAVGAGPRGAELRDGDKTLIRVYPIGGDWRQELKGWKFRLVGDEFGELKHRISAKLFPDIDSAKIAGKEYLLKFRKGK